MSPYWYLSDSLTAAWIAFAVFMDLSSISSDSIVSSADLLNISSFLNSYLLHITSNMLAYSCLLGRASFPELNLSMKIGKAFVNLSYKHLKMPMKQS